MLFDTKQYLPPLTIKPRQSSRRSPAPCQKALISPARIVERTDGPTVPADWGHDADERVGLGAAFWVQLWTALRREESHWMDAGELVSCPTLSVSHFVNSCCDSDSRWALQIQQTETSVSHENAPFRIPLTYPSFLQQVSIGWSLGGVCGLWGRLWFGVCFGTHPDGQTVSLEHAFTFNGSTGNSGPVEAQMIHVI